MKSILLLAFIVAAADIVLGQDGCIPTPAELDFRMWKGKNVGPCVDGCSCPELQDVWKVCTNEKDVNHKDVMTKCPVTCKIARGGCPGGCMPTRTELDFRMWPGKKVGSCVDGCSCQELQDGWKVCTNEEDVNHKGVMTKCPATCKIARGDCPATCAQPNTYLGGCPAAGCAIFDSVDDAKAECLKVSDCGGITVYPNGKKAELRKDTKGTPSPRGETSMLKACFE